MGSPAPGATPLPDLSPAAWIVVATMLVVGATLQGSVGFGMNVVAAPVLAIVEPRFVPIPLLVGALTMSVAVTIREHASLVPRDVSWALVGRVPGVAAGAAAVAVLARDQLALGLAAAVLVAVGISLTGWHVPVQRSTLVGAGFVSGFMGTSTSVGGPPMALLYQREAGSDVRANLSGFFAVGVVLSLAVLGATGQIERPDLALAGAVVPPVLLGFVLSSWTRHRVDRGRLRPFVLAISAVAAIALIVRVVAT